MLTIKENVICYLEFEIKFIIYTNDTNIFIKND